MSIINIKTANINVKTTVYTQYTC